MWYKKLNLKRCTVNKWENGIQHFLYWRGKKQICQIINIYFVWVQRINFSKKLSVLVTTLRSSRPEVFCKKGVLRNFAKFTGKHLCQSLFFNKAAGLRPTTLLKKRLWHRCFPVNFVKFLRTTFLQNSSKWLLL